MNATQALAGIGVTESDTGPYSYPELLQAMQDLLDNPPAEPETRIIPLYPMKTYQYQHADGRATHKNFSSDRLALRFLEELGSKWQLLTPISLPAKEPAQFPEPSHYDLTSRNALRYMAQQKYEQHPEHRTAYDFLRLPELLSEYAETLRELRDAKALLAAPPAHPEPAEAMREAAMWVQATLELMQEGPHPALASVTDALQTALGRLNGAAPAWVAPPVPTLVVAAGHNQAAADHGFAS